MVQRLRSSQTTPDPSVLEAHRRASGHGRRVRRGLSPSPRLRAPSRNLPPGLSSPQRTEVRESGSAPWLDHARLAQTNGCPRQESNLRTRFHVRGQARRAAPWCRHRCVRHNRRALSGLVLRRPRGTFRNCRCVGALCGVVAELARGSLFVTRFPNDPPSWCLSSGLSGQRVRRRSGVLAGLIRSLSTPLGACCLACWRRARSCPGSACSRTR